ncbi:MAG: hypothetical protein HYW02_02645 [Deltaproteobacteria bacterium]|nr:hypothetical protein [Deltaproteobacteria bacterium]
MGVEPYPRVSCGDSPGSPKLDCNGANPAHTYGRKTADLKLYGDPVRIADYVRREILPPRVGSSEEKARPELGKPYKRILALQGTVRIRLFWVVTHETGTKEGETTGRIIARGRNFDEKNPKPSMEIPVEFTPTEPGRYQIALYELRGNPAEGINKLTPFHVESVEIPTVKTAGGAKPAGAPPAATSKQPIRAEVKSITGDVGEVIINSTRGGGMYIKVTDPKGKIYEANITLEGDGSTIVRIIPSLESIVDGTYYDEKAGWIVKPEKGRHPESGTWKIEYMERVDGTLPAKARTTHTFGVPKEPKKSHKPRHREGTRKTTRSHPKAALPDIGNL